MKYEGSCHCGNVAFEVEGEFAEALDCNCSFCRKRGGLLGFVPMTQFELKTPREKVSTYTFKSHAIRHNFCADCGIAPYSEASAPDGTAMAAINLRCVPAVDLGALKINPYDGASR